jgi:hypothetical protein
MTIVLKYIGRYGMEIPEKVRKSQEVIDLSGQEISEIDLTPLSACAGLAELNLENNKIETLNLSPLSDCSKLTKLLLGNNKLQNADLSPLSSSIGLELLSLRSNKLHNINLSPLSACTRLRELDLYANNLELVDLGPLASCTSLQELHLGGNLFRDIDLAPLSLCASLDNLELRYNHLLRSIDLSPLSRCPKLEVLDLGMCGLQWIDLTPLQYCKNLKSINLINPLGTIDLTPLSYCRRLEKLNIGKFGQKVELDISPLLACPNLKDFSGEDFEPVGISRRMWLPEMIFFALMSGFWHDFGVVNMFYERQLKRADRPSSFWHVLHNLLDAYSRNSKYAIGFITSTQRIHSSMPLSTQRFEVSMGAFLQLEIARQFELDYFGLVDEDLTEQILEIAVDKTYDQVKAILKELFAEHLVKNIKRGLPTIGLNIEKALSENLEMAKFVEEIVGRRNRETDGVTIPLHGEYADLRPLWFTSYGFKYLFRKGYPLQIHETGLNRIQTDLSTLGINPTTYHDDGPILSSKWTSFVFPQLKISDKLRDGIYMLADMRGSVYFEGCEFEELGYKWIG